MVVMCIAVHGGDVYGGDVHSSWYMVVMCIVVGIWRDVYSSWYMVVMCMVVHGGDVHGGTWW